MSNINYFSEYGPLELDFDPSKYKSASGAAKAFHKALTELAESIGLCAEYVHLWNPEKASKMRGTDGWCVCWDEGCFEWSYGTASDINDQRGFANWYAEPYYSFDICFHNA